MVLIFLSLVLISRKHLRCWLKDVHRRQKLTTDFFQTFELTILVVTISISRKKSILTMLSRVSYFKGFDNKIIGFVRIQQFLTTEFFTI